MGSSPTSGTTQNSCKRGKTRSKAKGQDFKPGPFYTNYYTNALRQLSSQGDRFPDRLDLPFYKGLLQGLNRSDYLYIGFEPLKLFWYPALHFGV